MLTIIKYSDKPAEIVLVKQYRPPVKAISIEFPAGLIDPNETAEVAALREVKEETGLTGVVKGITPAIVADPGLSSANMKIVHVEVNGDLEINKSGAKQHPDDREFVEVVTVKLPDLLSTLIKWAEEGCAVDANVYCFAYGREVKI
eukprot:TRINITY_DN10381_c0_g1_i1.p2 TRINITY_DN10381_c0_g1~~TRINITY_DN10381_c0_g1_i1.p2  ORF type:complete len:146 (-),score=30.15 TRINITY_DN10381_c0_g1_i1:642-1079(-)